MAGKRAQFQSEQFYDLLNSRDDLTAIVHGMSYLDVLLDQGLDVLLASRGQPDGALSHLRFMQKVDVLIAADSLDLETRDEFEHLSGVRGRFAHQIQTEFTKDEGIRAWDTLPARGRSAAPAIMKRTSRRAPDDETDPLGPVPCVDVGGDERIRTAE
jgi:hypothetical protein